MKRPRVKEIPLIDFSGQIMAIDGHNWVYKYFMVANKVVTGHTNVGSQEVNRQAVLYKLYTSALDYVAMFIGHGITPVFVFDGDYPPEKAPTQDKRKQDKQNAREEAKVLQDKLKQESPFDRNPDEVTRLKQLLTRTGFLEKSEIKGMVDLLSGIGIPVLQAVGDAEQLCASMAREGLVSAVYSEDTDNLVYGCPILITEIGQSYRDETTHRFLRKAGCVILSDVLADLDWTQDMFIDFCITLGCDYNTRIKGLGPKTAKRLIDEFKKIEDYPKKYDLTCLNHLRCREIFTHRQPVRLVDGNQVSVTSDDLQINKSFFLAQGRDNLTTNEIGDLSEYYRRLHSLYNALPDRATGKLPNTTCKKKVIVQRRNKSLIE